MSTCADFRAMILEAEPMDLRGEGDTELAVHVRGCPACARVAALVLDETARLDAYLGDTPVLDVEAVLARAALPAEAPEAVAHRTLPVSKAYSFPGRRILVPLAAAAALAALLLMRGQEIRSPATSIASSPAEPAVAPLVEPIAGQGAAIMQTDDPEITVVWLFTTG